MGKMLANVGVGVLVCVIVGTESVGVLVGRRVLVAGGGLVAVLVDAGVLVTVLVGTGGVSVGNEVMVGMLVGTAEDDMVGLGVGTES